MAKLTFEDESPWVFDISPDGGRAIVRWKHVTTLHDLTRKGAILETLPLCASNVALGPGEALALTFKEALIRDRDANEKKPWYQSDDMDGDVKNDHHVKNEVGKKRQKQLDNARVQLTFTPFSKYKPVTK